MRFVVHEASALVDERGGVELDFELVFFAGTGRALCIPS